MMKFRLFVLLFISLQFVACNKEDTQSIAAEKDAQKKEQIFKNINKGWNFNHPKLNPKSQEIVRNWTELRNFLNELDQKPQSSIGAFQKKSRALSKTAAELNKNIPLTFDKPEVKSRIAVLNTKVNSINLFINLQEIPDQKVIILINDINIELTSLFNQMDEIVRKREIPREEGETDMIRMLDTSRAIPNTPNNKIILGI